MTTALNPKGQVENLLKSVKSHISAQFKKEPITKKQKKLNKKEAKKEEEESKKGEGENIVTKIRQYTEPIKEEIKMGDYVLTPEEQKKMNRKRTPATKQQLYDELARNAAKREEAVLLGGEEHDEPISKKKQKQIDLVHKKEYKDKIQNALTREELESAYKIATTYNSSHKEYKPQIEKAYFNRLEEFNKKERETKTQNELQSESNDAMIKLQKEKNESLTKPSDNTMLDVNNEKPVGSQIAAPINQEDEKSTLKIKDIIETKSKKAQAKQFKTTEIDINDLQTVQRPETNPVKNILPQDQTKINDVDRGQVELINPKIIQKHQQTPTDEMKEEETAVVFNSKVPFYAMQETEQKEQIEKFNDGEFGFVMKKPEKTYDTNNYFGSLITEEAEKLDPKYDKYQKNERYNRYLVRQDSRYKRSLARHNRKIPVHEEIQNKLNELPHPYMRSKPIDITELKQIRLKELEDLEEQQAILKSGREQAKSIGDRALIGLSTYDRFPQEDIILKTKSTLDKSNKAFANRLWIDSTENSALGNLSSIKAIVDSENKRRFTNTFHTTNPIKYREEPKNKRYYDDEYPLHLAPMSEMSFDTYTYPMTTTGNEKAGVRNNGARPPLFGEIDEYKTRTDGLYKEFGTSDLGVYPQGQRYLNKHSPLIDKLNYSSVIWDYSKNRARAI